VLSGVVYMTKSRSLDVVGHVTIRFAIDYFLFASSEFSGKAHHLATMHTLHLQTDDRQTDRRNTVA